MLVCAIKILNIIIIIIIIIIITIYSDKTTWRPQWKTPLENPWKHHFRDSQFQNIPKCLGPQKLVPLVRVPKPPTIHYQPAT